MQAQLALQVEKYAVLEKQIVVLKRQMKEKSDAKQDPKASSDNGGSSAQPEVREEDGDSAKGR